jgi:hypothetical protein
MAKSLRERDASFFFWLSLVYLVVLLVGVLGRDNGWFRLNEIADPIGGLLPLGVPWFGALGAVSISLYGVFDHNHEWDTKWNYWHVARPIMGIVLATLAYFIFIGLINSTGASAPTSTDDVAQTTMGTTTTMAASTTTTTTTKNATTSTVSEPAAGMGVDEDGGTDATKLVPYYVLAFIVGFREQTFRDLIKRASDTLLGPGIPGDTPPAGIAISPSPVVFAATTVGQTKDVRVTVTNIGSGNLFMNAADVEPPGAALAEATGPFSIVEDAVTAAVIAPRTAAGLTVRFAPTTPGDFTGVMKLGSNAGNHVVALTGHADAAPT